MFPLGLFTKMILIVMNLFCAVALTSACFAQSAVKT